MAKDKGKSKETKPPSEAKDATKAKDAAAKAKETETKPNEADPRAKDTLASQPSKKENPPAPRLNIRILFLLSFFFGSFPCIFFCSGVLPLNIMYFCLYSMKRLAPCVHPQSTWVITFCLNKFFLLIIYD